MNELDENGWAHVHHAAFRGFVKSIERFVAANPEQLELETGDELHSTPLHLAVMSSNLDTVRCLVDLGAKVNALNSQDHGVVELSCMKHYLHMLEFFIGMEHEDLPVWQRLMRFLSSLSDEECERAGACLHTLLTPADTAQLPTSLDEADVNPFWAPALQAGFVNTAVKVIKSSISDEAKIETFQALLAVISLETVRSGIAAAGGIPALVKLLRSGNLELVQLAARTLREMSQLEKLAAQAYQAGAIPALVRVLQGISREFPEVLSEAVQALGAICETCEAHQSAAGRENGCLTTLVSLYEECLNKSLLHSLTVTVGKLASGHRQNQDALVSCGVNGSVITLARVKSRKLQLCAVTSIQLLAEHNPNTQRRLLDDGAVVPLLALLRRTRTQQVQEKAAAALWALAGENVEERTSMATQIGVPLLIEFLQSVSEKLHFIASEGLGVLAQGAVNDQDFIGQQNGVQPLVRLLRSDKEEIVLSAVRALRALCVGIGFVPNARNQGLLSLSRGVKFLVALMVHARNEIIQVEAAVALSFAAMNNAEVQRELQSNIEFSYVRVLKMLYSKSRVVQLMAGAALAAFAYNNVAEQRELAAQGGIRFVCLLPFLQSNDELERCMAAFQVVVLSRIIPDEEQALSSATGIKLIVDLLNDSTNAEIIALASDCIARLAHTRAGVPQAMVSIGVVAALCRHMLSSRENVRGCAAIALAYLSHSPQARREILHRFRQDPYMMLAMRHYVSTARLNADFVGGWQHYAKVGLPPIQPGRPQLTRRSSVDIFKEAGGRQLTLLSLDSDGGDGEAGGGGAGGAEGGGLASRAAPPIIATDSSPRPPDAASHRSSRASVSTALRGGSRRTSLSSSAASSLHSQAAEA